MTAFRDAAKAAAIEALRAGPMSGGELVRTTRIGATTMHQALRELHTEGVISSRGAGALSKWELTGSSAANGEGARPSLPAQPPAQSTSERVALAEQLLDLERVIEETIARRDEILEALRT